MKKYAMVLLGRVVGVIDSEVVPSWPPDPDGNPVSAAECDDAVVIGMVYKNGKFEPYVEPLEPYQPTEGELMIMETQATMYEEMQSNKLAQMEANADIYEAISALGGNV